MKVYQCLMSGDEMFTETTPMTETDGFYILKGKFVTTKADGVDESLLGANPSAEEAAEGTEDGTMESGVDVIIYQRLQETGFGSKKDYQIYMKDYIKNVFSKLAESGKSADELAKMKENVAIAFKEACANFKEWQFYSGASMDPDGHIALVDWKDEEVDGKTVSTPYLYFYKAGIKAVEY